MLAHSCSRIQRNIIVLGCPTRLYKMQLVCFSFEQMTSSEPSVQGFGYIITPHPNDATFKFLGQYHIVSYFPESHIPDPIEEVKICLWLGPGMSLSRISICFYIRISPSPPDPGVLEVFVYLIWPGKGLLNFGQACVSSGNQFCVVLTVSPGSVQGSLHELSILFVELVHFRRKLQLLSPATCFISTGSLVFCLSYGAQIPIPL
jgi:hypothetical protein